MKQKIESILGSKRVDDVLTRVFFCGSVAFATAVVLCVTLSVIETWVYHVRDTHHITYVVLLISTFLILWFLILRAESACHLMNHYRDKSRVYNKEYHKLLEKIESHVNSEEGIDFVYDKDKKTYEIKDLNLSDITKNNLMKAEVSSLKDLSKYSTEEIAGIVGQDGLKELIKAMGDVCGEDFIKEFGVEDGVA